MRKRGASLYVYRSRLTDYIRKGFDSESKGFGGLHATGLDTRAPWAVGVSIRFVASHTYNITRSGTE